MPLKIIGEITDIEIVAVGKSIREINRLNKVYGRARWRKMKGFTKLLLDNGKRINAEIHWYEAHGFGKIEYKIKRILK
ncbi:MAG: hypothetical protein AB1775_02540 [Bacteroidota bacterium]|nr:hypothetical protein [Bacteroidota bacterium]